MRAVKSLVLVIRILPFGVSVSAAGPSPLDDFKEIEIRSLIRCKKDISVGSSHPVNFS
jgi:hypothetical protein